MKLTNSKLLAIKDVCRITGLSRQYVDQLCREKKLRFELTTAGRIFLEKDILEFQKKRLEKAKYDPRIKINKQIKKHAEKN
jgi:predicted DNA-binding transcriptional regulator AlpA